MNSRTPARPDPQSGAVDRAWLPPHGMLEATIHVFSLKTFGDCMVTAVVGLSVPLERSAP